MVVLKGVLMKALSIGQMKEITDEYYQWIEDGWSRRKTLRHLERKFNISRKQVVDTIEGWKDK